MATRVCPTCGTQYVATVRRCIDCDAVLVDEVSTSTGDERVSAAAPVGEGDQIAYELEGWGNQLKVTLEGMLDRAGIRRVWESGALVVPAEFEEQVDALVATVEGAEPEDLDEDAAWIAFDIEDVNAQELEELDARLIAANIAHAWEDDGTLLVGEADEEQAAELITAVLEGSEEPDDGLATQEALSDVFVAVDKLQKDPSERKLVERYREAAKGLEGRSVPYGLSGADWQALLDQVAELAELVDLDRHAAEEEIEVEVIEEVEVDEVLTVDELARAKARALREALIDYV